jgi:hypothetical protein
MTLPTEAKDLNASEFTREGAVVPKHLAAQQGKIISTASAVAISEALVSRAAIDQRMTHTLIARGSQVGES